MGCLVDRIRIITAKSHLIIEIPHPRRQHKSHPVPWERSADFFGDANHEYNDNSGFWAGLYFIMP